MKNNIIHVDIDAFYASVEELDNKELKNHPVVVGGLSDSSIVTTANYEARKYGIHSAMPIFMAKSLCSDLIVVPVRRDRYLEKSKEVFEILKTYSETIEKVSIDEAYLDISDNKMKPVDIVFSIMKRVKKETGLTVSIGLSYNKFLAKVASDWNKPQGMMIINKSEVPDILLKLDISKVHGIGAKSEKKFRNIGIHNVEDLLQLSNEFLEENFGKMGHELYDRIRGKDDRKVTPYRERKSIGVERTFKGTRDVKILYDYIEKFSLELSKELKFKNLGFNTLTVKLKNADFESTTKSKTFEKTITDYEDILSIAIDLFNEVYNGDSLRLLGVSASNLSDLSIIQLSFI